MKKNIRSKSKSKPRAVGTGFIALDVVRQASDPHHLQLFAGGTSANVLLALGFLGFDSSVIGRLKNDTAADTIRNEFRRWGVSTKDLSMQEDGSTPIVLQTIRATPNGPTHSFGWRCPHCGSRFPSHKPLLASTAELIASKMSRTQVFFFDRVNRGSLVLAKKASELGALVVFEPSGVNDLRLFKEAWNLSHVVKYSHVRLAELPEGLEFGNQLLLQIETLGDEGLRYRAQFKNGVKSPWKSLNSISAKIVKDTAGAGDWCTAGILSKTAAKGFKGFSSLSPSQLESAIRFGQGLAAWNCGFIGARGGMYSQTLSECLHYVADLLKGHEVSIASPHPKRKAKVLDASWCPSCHDTTPIAIDKPHRTIA